MLKEHTTMKNATIFDIQRASFVDGPGIRTTVFFKGCNLKCKWCHNPESQSFHKQMLFYQEKCTGCGKCKEKCKNDLVSCDLCGTCALYCPNDAREICGKTYTIDEVFKEIYKDKSLYDKTGGGATFSGGECMLQIDFLIEILKKCKENGIHTAVDTAGHLPYEYFERILPYTDLFLYDVKCFDSKKHEKYVGVGNEQIFDNLKKLLSIGKKIWVRIPTIADINDSEEEMNKIKSFFTNFGWPEKVELLPYHAMGEHKYTALSRETCKFKAPDKEKLEALKNLFNNNAVENIIEK